MDQVVNNLRSIILEYDAKLVCIIGGYLLTSATPLQSLNQTMQLLKTVIQSTPKTVDCTTVYRYYGELMLELVKS